MNLPRRTFLQFAGAAVAIPAASRIANAQTYPTRPITIMVGAAAGGPTDTIARILAQHMRVSLRQAMIIENNGTAGGTIAYGRGARCPRRLHPQPRAEHVARLERRRLHPLLQRAEGFLADFADFKRSTSFRRKEQPSGQRSQ
jgi:hypothetical protein